LSSIFTNFVNALTLADACLLELRTKLPQDTLMLALRWCEAGDFDEYLRMSKLVVQQYALVRQTIVLKHQSTKFCNNLFTSLTSGKRRFYFWIFIE